MGVFKRRKRCFRWSRLLEVCDLVSLVERVEGARVGVLCMPWLEGAGNCDVQRGILSIIPMGDKVAYDMSRT
jgi:hypothetical protein